MGATDEPGELIGSLLATCQSKSYQRGQVAMLEGSSPNRVMVVRSGEFGLRKTNLDGREITIAHRRSGELVGELAVVTGTLQATTVVATNQASATTISGDTFRDLLASRPELALTLMRNLATRLSDTSEQLLELATDGGMSRLCKRLVRLAETGSQQCGADIEHVSVRIGSQEDLAHSIGLQRSAVVKHLGELRRQGWIDTNRGVIYIHAMDRLRVNAATPKHETTA